MSCVKIVKRVKSQLELNTIKYGLELKSDKSYIEAVLMPTDNYSLCISTQVGCKVNCEFCESKNDLFYRNLNTDEIISTIEIIQKDVEKKGIRISYILFQGVGEPLMNLDNVFNSIKLLKKNSFWALSRFCISTICSDNILKIITQNVPVNLFFSLHGTTDEQRRKLIPYAKNQTIKDILNVLKEYERKGSRDTPVGIQYLLLDKFNDSLDDAYRLVEMFSDGDYLIVLKEVCDIENQKYLPSSNHKFKLFKNVLHNAGILYHISRSRARDNNGGCGQLRIELTKKIKLKNNE